MMQVGTNQSTTYHSQPTLTTSGGQTGRSSSTSRQQQQQQQQYSQYDNEQIANIRPRLCILRKWPHYDGYGVHLARNQHWLGLRIGDVEPNSPAESGGLLREDVVLAVNGHSVENDDFFVILSFIQRELEDDQIRFLVVDPHSADLARRHHLNIDENYRTCVRMETPILTVSPEKLLYDQLRTTSSNNDPTAAQNTIHLGPTLSLNQNQMNLSNQRYQDKSPREGPEVYTFLPYSDHAVENGKSFFDILFEQENNLSSRTQQHLQEDIRPKDHTGDDKNKSQTSTITDGVIGFVKSGIGGLKNLLPTRHRDDEDHEHEHDIIKSKRRTSSESSDSSRDDDESPSFVKRLKDTFKISSTPSNTPDDQEKSPQPYGRIWQASSKSEDTNNNLRPEPRMCSMTIRPGIDTIGISLKSDKDFGHVIKQVEPDSLADRSGIERDDCIISLNDVTLLNIPYDDVLNILKQSRNQTNLDFLVAKKSYLLKSRQNNTQLSNSQQDIPDKYYDTTGQVMPSSNISERTIPSDAGAAQALEQLYNKYNNERQSSFDEQTTSNRPKETVSTTTNGRFGRASPTLDDDRYLPKQQQQQQQGQILQGVGPATADRSSWGVSSGKSTDLQGPISGDSSIRSNIRGQRTDIDDTKGRGSSFEDSFKPLQVGITNKTPTQQTGNISPTNLPADEYHTSRPTSSIEQRDSSPKRLPSPDRIATSTRGDITSPSRQNETIQNLPSAVPITPTGTSSTIPDYEQRSSQTTPSTQSDLRLATMSLSDLKEHGYEFHNIQLMQPTETSPVGLKLTKQQDPLQYIITAVAKGTKADLAGLKINDWLIKIENNDVRLVEFSEVSQDIRQLLTNAGLINMVVARKKTSSPLTTQQIDKGQTTISSSSRSESFNRQQGGQIPTSLLTTDITRDTPDNSQVRFVPDRSTSPSTVHSQRPPVSTRETNINAPGGPLSVGLTNPISDENITRSPRSQSSSPSRSPNRSPTREATFHQQEKKPFSNQPSEDYDENDIRHIVLKEALGLDFNSFIPEGDSQIQTHFISNVQPSSMADKAGLRDGDRILTVNGVDVTNSIHEDVRRMMQTKKPLQLTVVNDARYLELIENVKRNQNKPETVRDKKASPPPDYESIGQKQDPTTRSRSPVKRISSESSDETKFPRPKSESPKLINDDFSQNFHALFTDDKGSVKVKHCILKKDPTYNGYGLVLRYQNGLHLIDQVEEDSPAHKAGLREDDIILFVDKKNVELLTHDDVKILIRKLSLSNTNIDLVLIKKNDVSRYKIYQEKKSIDWKPILDDQTNNETIQSDQSISNVSRSYDQTNDSRKSSSSSSGKQAAPPPPISSTSQSATSPSTRVCILQPSADRTAGFALSGKTSPPYIICQVEKNSPADKAGLHINDALISINGKLVTETSYEDTVKLVKEALQKKSVELVVREPSSQLDDNTKNQDRTKFSMGSSDSGNAGNQGSIGGDPSQQGANAVEEYQKQRNKELSYTLRLCHLHPTNSDGTHAATFGFELSEDPDYEYPIILRVEQQSPAEGAGLQSRDVLLKINERKTKNLGYDKVKKEIEKARRDGRLEMLVADQETFDYCQRSKKPLKEPEMKVKHIFPKSRSSASFHKLPVAATGAATTSMSSKDSPEQLHNSNRKSTDSISSAHNTSVGYHLPTSKETDSENEENAKQDLSEQKSSPPITSQAKTTRPSQPAVSFDLSTPPSTLAHTSARSHETPLKFLDPALTKSEQKDTSTNVPQNVPSPSRSTTSTKESKPSKAKAIPNAINNLFHKIGHSKSSKRS